MAIETKELKGKLNGGTVKGGQIAVTGPQGVGIQKIEKTNTVGKVDTYTITYTDETITTFEVTNGSNGINGVNGINGTNGINGKSLLFNWSGTQLGIKTEDATNYTYVNLKGETGDIGPQGLPGEVTLQQLNNVKIQLEEHKYKLTITETIQANTNITIPINYKVGADVLDVYYMGEKLILNKTGQEGHYNEVGDANSISNEIQVGWNLFNGLYFDFVVRGEYNVES